MKTWIRAMKKEQIAQKIPGNSDNTLTFSKGFESFFSETFATCCFMQLFITRMEKYLEQSIQ